MGNYSTSSTPASHFTTVGTSCKSQTVEQRTSENQQTENQQTENQQTENQQSESQSEDLFKSAGSSIGPFLNKMIHSR